MSPEVAKIQPLKIQYGNIYIQIPPNDLKSYKPCKRCVRIHGRKDPQTIQGRRIESGHLLFIQQIFSTSMNTVKVIYLLTC